MNEKLLQFLWQFKLIPFNHLTTHTGEQIEIIDPGQLNHDSGPDFFNAKVKMDNTIWAGNIEMHLKASLWKVHKHHLDQAYNNVILHVVLENDALSFNAAGDEVPTVVLEVPEHIQHNQDQLHKNKSWLKCSHSIQSIDPFFIRQYMDALAIERLANKQKFIERLLAQTDDNWEQTCYNLLARNFGFNINAEPFQQLAQKVPHKILMQYGNDPELMEALLYGSAGFLDELINEDPYYQNLSRNFKHLQRKHGIKPLEKHIWKFAKTRPSNFPTLRISEFSQLYFKQKNLFSSLLECNSLKEIEVLFRVSASTYWNNHYRFNIPSKKSLKKPGKAAINGIIINTIVPLLFSYGKLRGNSLLCERALLLLGNLRAESNSIVKAWDLFGVKGNDAKDSQALLHLRTMYCNKNKCVQCRIGLKVLTKKN